MNQTIIRCNYPSLVKKSVFNLPMNCRLVSVVDVVFVPSHSSAEIYGRIMIIHPCKLHPPFI